MGLGYNWKDPLLRLTLPVFESQLRSCDLIDILLLQLQCGPFGCHLFRTMWLRKLPCSRILAVQHLTSPNMLTDMRQLPSTAAESSAPDLSYNVRKRQEAQSKSKFLGR